MRNEKREKRNLGQKALSDSTKVDFGARKDHGWQGVLNITRYQRINNPGKTENRREKM